MNLSTVNNISSVFRQSDELNGSSGTLLNMLAEVASQKLCNEKDIRKKTSLKTTGPKKLKVSTSAIKHKRQNKKNSFTLNLKYINRDISDYTDNAAIKTNFLNSINNKESTNFSEKGGPLCYRMTANQIRGLSSSQLIRLFTVLEDDEMKKTFYFQCKFLPSCQKRFFSFGSEEKARHLVKQHLHDHVQSLTSESLIEVPQKYEITSSSSRRRNIKNFKKISNNIVKSSDINKISNIKKHKKRFTANENEFKNCLIYKSKNDNIIQTFFSTDGRTNFETRKYQHSTSKTAFTNAENQADDDNENSTDHNYYRYMNSKNAGNSAEDNSNVSNNERSNIIDNTNKDMHDNDFVGKFFDKTDLSSASSSERSNRKTAVPKSNSTDVPNNSNKKDSSYYYYCDDTGDRSNNCNYSLMENNMQVIDMSSVDYITPVEHEVTVLTEVDNTPLSESAVVDDTGLKDDNLESPKDILTVDTKVESNVTVYELANSKSQVSIPERKPKGKAKFIGRSAEEREMAVEMIKTLKREKDGGALECRICRPKRVFTAPTTLISHYRSHAGIKPYECLLCKAMFTRQHSLNYHLLIHLNQTRFTCEVCGRKFRHPSHFKEHQRRHTGESPYHCPDCAHRFKTRNTYKRHLKTRHNKILSHSGAIISAPDNFDGSATIAPTPMDVMENLEETTQEENVHLESADEMNESNSNNSIGDCTPKQFDEIDCDVKPNALNIGINDLDKENNIACVTNAVGSNNNKRNNISINDSITKKQVIAANVANLNAKNLKYVSNSSNKNAVFLSFVPTLQQPQYQLLKTVIGFAGYNSVRSSPTIVLNNKSKNSTIDHNITTVLNSDHNGIEGATSPATIPTMIGNKN